MIATQQPVTSALASDESQAVEAPPVQVAAPQGTMALSGIGPFGIGQAIARELRADGWHVVCCDRDGERGQAAIQELGPVGIDFVQADLATAAGVDRFLDRVGQAPWPLRGLVCNAGSAGDPDEDDILRMSLEHFRQLLDNNLASTWFAPAWCKRAAPTGSAACG